MDDDKAASIPDHKVDIFCLNFMLDKIFHTFEMAYLVSRNHGFLLFLGLEDVGSFLYKQGVTLHEFLNSINERALDNTYDYYKKYRAFQLDRSKLPRDTEARAVMIDRVSAR